MTSQNPFKICLAASAGGHLSQLLKLVNSWVGCETFYITTTNIVQDKMSRLGRIYIVGECNHQQPIRTAKVLLRCIKIILREKPDVIISTGAAPGCIICFLGKLMRAKVVWVDSITNVERISLSGRLVRYIANLFLVQWPELAEQYHNAEYIGAVI